MKVNLLLTVVLSWVAATPALDESGVPSVAPAAAPAADDPCGAPLPVEPSGAGPLRGARDRVPIACELRDVVEARYVFFPVKSRLLGAPGRPGLDPRRHLDACVEAERALAVEDEPLRFYDRMRRCVAAFEDGHLILRVPSGLPTVALGLGLRRAAADGRVYVATRAPRLAELLGAADVAALLAPGTEVLEIDGRPVSDAIADLARFVPGGSAAARAERAVDALTRRDFAYPERRTATLAIVVGVGRRTVELPWWIAPGAERNELARGLVARAALVSTDLLDWRTDPRAAWGGTPPEDGGVRRGDPIVPPDEAARLTEYAGDGGLVAARLGELTRTGEAPYCYAQFVSFHTETLSSGGVSRPFVDVVEDFVAGCAARRRDLVLDLRQNEGGYLSHSTALAALLLPRGGSSPGGALLLRATAFNERVYRERAPVIGGLPGLPQRWRSEPERVLDAIRAARASHQEFSRAFLDGPLRSDPDAGFDGRIVALVSPGCMSACERLAGLLRSGGRAVLVGGPTEGAGGSQQEAKDLLARWTDRTKRLSLSVPNAAMGVQGADDGGDASSTRFFEALAFENRPVVPHVPYATTLDDLTHHDRGWRAQAEAALRAPPAPAAPPAATALSAPR